MGFTAFYSIPVLLAVSKILATTVAISACAIVLGTAIKSRLRREPFPQSLADVGIIHLRSGHSWFAIVTNLAVASIVPSLVMGLIYLNIWGLQPVGNSLADFRIQIHQQYWTGAKFVKGWHNLKNAAHLQRNFPATGPSGS